MTAPTPAVELLDETLRDGLQSPSVAQPKQAEKIELVDLMARIGIKGVNIGFPAVGQRVLEDVVALARHVEGRRLPLDLTCAARTMIADVVPIARAVQRSGRAIEACLFVGSSPIRLWTEGWDRKLLVARTVEAIDFAIKEGLGVAYAAEDATRSAPWYLDELFRAAIDRGARRLVLCDTVGHATPDGTEQLVTWTRSLVRGLGLPVKIDWHGHNDRGLALGNALRALDSGADRVHACALGIGERVGNTSMELLVRNLQLLGTLEVDPLDLERYVEKATEMTRIRLATEVPVARQARAS